MRAQNCKFNSTNYNTHVLQIVLLAQTFININFNNEHSWSHCKRIQLVKLNGVDQLWEFHSTDERISVSTLWLVSISVWDLNSWLTDQTHAASAVSFTVELTVHMIAECGAHLIEQNKCVRKCPLSTGNVVITILTWRFKTDRKMVGGNVVVSNFEAVQRLKIKNFEKNLRNKVLY